MDIWVVLRVVGNYLIAAVLAGGIAYLGNHLGRQIGKKRMSVLGMRPRHTSNFITVVTGSLIAVATLTLAAGLSREVRGVLTGIDEARRELARLENEVERVRRHLSQSRVVYGVGQAILQGTLEPGIPEATQRLRITGVLDLANVLAIQRNNDVAREKGEELLDPTTQLLEWDEAQVTHLATVMVNEEKVAGVRIVAKQNSLYRDKVPVDLEPVKVSRVFRQGEIVATHRLQPKDAELLREWYAFLDQVRESALRKGMIEINDSLGGGLSSQDFERLIQDIKRLQGPGKLVAVAKHDLYQTSALAIRIEVRAVDR